MAAVLSTAKTAFRARLRRVLWVGAPAAYLAAAGKRPRFENGQVEVAGAERRIAGAFITSRIQVRRAFFFFFLLFLK